MYAKKKTDMEVYLSKEAENLLAKRNVSQLIRSSRCRFVHSLCVVLLCLVWKVCALHIDCLFVDVIGLCVVGGYTCAWILV